MIALNVLPQGFSWLELSDGRRVRAFWCNECRYQFLECPEKVSHCGRVDNFPQETVFKKVPVVRMPEEAKGTKFVEI
jgi:hypothetical protein